MPFRASAPFLHEGYWCRIIDLTSYQCPFGLGLHFYFWDSLLMVFIALNVSMPFRAGASFLRQQKPRQKSCSISAYQCPFGLGLHFYITKIQSNEEIVISYQCPLGLVLHFYTSQEIRKRAISKSVSMPFRACSPFLHGIYELKNECTKKYQCPFGLKLHFYCTPSKT